MKSVRCFVTGAAFAAIAAGWSGAAVAQETVTVWFTKGFYKGEDDALLAVVDKFQKATGVKVELSLYATEDCVTKSVGAVEAGTPPDVGFCTTYDFRTTGKWAFEGKLEDVTDVITPIAAEFQPQALATTFLMNGKTNKKAYYAFPVEQQMMHITYWKDMLEEAGFKESDIPKGWNGYWDFWCDKVQGAMRAKTHNATISIAGKHMDDMTNMALTQEQRDQAKKNYEDNIRTAEFPTKPDGSKMTNLAAVKTAVIFADAKNKKRAKEFMAFLLKDENLQPFVDGSTGRWVPTTLKGIESPFWTSGKDPHRAVVYKQYKDGTVPFQFVYNFNFTTLNAENVWAKAVNRVVQDKVPAEQAVDEMIARIKQVAG